MSKWPENYWRKTSVTSQLRWRIHPPKQTWNLKMGAPWKRRFLLETIISRFHVNFWGCISNVKIVQIQLVDIFHQQYHSNADRPNHKRYRMDTQPGYTETIRQHCLIRNDTCQSIHNLLPWHWQFKKSQIWRHAIKMHDIAIEYKLPRNIYLTLS